MRLCEWQKQCGNDSEGCESTIDRSLEVKVRNVKRLENLVHAELKEYRRKQLGCRSGKTHVEWFQVDIELVQMVIEKWTTWLIEQPRYADCIGGSLHALEEKEMKRLCSVLPFTPQTRLEVSKPQKPHSSRVREKDKKFKQTRRLVTLTRAITGGEFQGWVIFVSREFGNCLWVVYNTYGRPGLSMALDSLFHRITIPYE